jgi:hypothetical protein
MDAKPYLEIIAAGFHRRHLDAVMIGNAAAAINGAPVTTLDIDFVVEKNPENYQKLAVIAQDLNCQFIELKLADDNYMYRLVHKEMPLVIDILFSLAGIKNIAVLKKNAMVLKFGGHPLRIAALADIIRSKKAANRPKDQATLPILELTLNEKNKNSTP